jgi:metal-dependent amidase/aminoacylase/carboxypeptidase family protein
MSEVARSAALLGIALACAAPLSLAAPSLPVAPAKLEAEVQTLIPGLETLYQEIHQHPELAFHETRTAAVLAHQMRRLGFTVTEGVGGTGLVAIYENGPGPTVLVRTELDALPIKEATDLPYASQDPTADHSEGHDLHMAIWVGTAATLLQFKSRWQGRLMFVGEPAAETLSGARAMLADGLYTRFSKPDYALTLHVQNSAAGHLMLKPGTWSDAIDYLQIRVNERDAADLAVLQLALRSVDSQVRASLLDGIRRAAADAAVMAKAPPPEVVVTDSTAAVENDPALTARTATIFQRLFGDDVEVQAADAEPAAATDDFSEFGTSGVASIDYSLGSYDPKVLKQDKVSGTPVPANGSQLFAPATEPTISVGVRAMSYAVINLLQRR